VHDLIAVCAVPRCVILLALADEGRYKLQLGEAERSKQLTEEQRKLAEEEFIKKAKEHENQLKNAADKEEKLKVGGCTIYHSRC